MRGQVRCDLPAPNAGTGQERPFSHSLGDIPWGTGEVQPPGRPHRGQVMHRLPGSPGDRGTGQPVFPRQSRSIRGQVTCGLPAARAGHRSRAALVPDRRSRGQVRSQGQVRHRFRGGPADGGQVSRHVSPARSGTGQDRPFSHSLGDRLSAASRPPVRGTGRAPLWWLPGGAGDRPRGGLPAVGMMRGQVRCDLPAPNAGTGQTPFSRQS